MSDTYDSFAIYPALNVARVGNADEYYIGSEIPGVYVGKGDPEFKFKDKNGRVKPQAARFRIYGYKDDKVVGEIKTNDSSEPEIKWTVVLANKKAAHRCFSGIKDHNKKGIIRNPDWPYDRSTLMAIREHNLCSGCGEDREGCEGCKGKKEREFNARVYRHNDEDVDSHDGQKLYLGKIILEDEGSLIIIGGKGKSGCVKESALITNYVNNDYWYDDTSDGSVDATVTIVNNDGERVTLMNREGKSWVLVAPPKYAPSISNIVPLYQVILEAQHPVDPDNPVNDPVVEEDKKDKEVTKVEYYRDIYPIFEAVCKSSWVNKKGFMGHGLNRPGYFLNSELEKKLSDPDPQNKGLRQGILSRVRIPADLASRYECDGQAYDYFMPPLSGNDGDVRPSVPETYLTVTRGQYLLLQKWANGDFIKGNKPIKYKYQDEPIEEYSRKPTYLDDDENPYKFEDIAVTASKQVKFLNKAALEWCVGGPFYPGIEITYLVYDKNTFNEYDFRINSKVFQPGDINAYMALPWQADFTECNTNWWPAQRPDVAIPEENLESIKEREIQLDDFEEWTRGFRNNETNQDDPKWGDMDMSRAWDRLGFIVEKKRTNGEISLVEIERGLIYEFNKGDIAACDFTLDNLYSLLNVALQIELSTIPPYLYAVYSIKPGTNTGDVIRYNVRHVAAEEMLHASLVANLIVAIGRHPVFYSPKTIPYYPNPLPHIQQGLLMVHLSKADKNAFDTFIKIEAPENSPVIVPTIPKEDLPINVESIGQLYEVIRRFFKKLSDEIKYHKNFQLGPGMGYAPSTGTGNEGLMIIEDLDSVDRAIDLIISQGEGKPNQTEMKITNGKIDGTIKGEVISENADEKIEGIIEGNIKGDVTIIKDKKEGKFEGRIEKGKFEGKIEGNTVRGKIIEGIIKGFAEIGSEANQTIERIFEEGTFEETINECTKRGVKFEKSIGGTIKGNIEEESHYNTFRLCKIYIENAHKSEYQLWPVMEDPDVSSYTDPKIVATATAFNASYSYLMLLLQAAWRTDGEKKKMLVMGGMPALMHGVLKPIAMFLAEIPTSTDTNAGATFGYYKFTRETDPKPQLIEAVKAASEAFPYNDKLKDALRAVTSLPGVSLPIFSEI